LLAADAPVEQLSAAIDEHIAAAQNKPYEVEQLREDLRCSLLIKSELEERRRREHELAALFETAGDLTSIRDVEDVLRAIVQRVRNLVGSETAYLMLVDEEAGDTYMRVGEGITTRVFSRIRLPLGGGLGGLVAQQACPYSTICYLTDDRFEHHEEVDFAVSEEGLVAIMGVPLMLGERLLGVLFVADRRERRYSRQDTALLLSLANQAAVALENARLFRESQLALTELAAAKALIEDHSHEVERSVDAHERLTGVILRGGSLHDVAEALAEVLDGTILVVAPTGQILSGGGEPVDDLDQQLLDHQDECSIPHDLLGSLGEVEQRRQTLRTELSGWLEPRWITPIVAGGEVLACLVLATRRPLAPVDVRTFERAAQVTALLLVWQRSAAEAEQRARGDLVDDLLGSAALAPGSVRRRCDLIGVRPDDEYALVMVQTCEDDRHRCVAAAAALAAERNGLAGQHGTGVVVLLPGLAPAEAAELVQDRLHHQLRTTVTAGADGPVTLLADLRSCHERARRCVRLLLGLGRSGRSAAADDLGVYGLLFGDAKEGQLHQFVDQRLAPLVTYDEEHGTDLLATLSAYLSTGRRHTVTAQQLHIHANTLYQRLERIGELAGFDFEDADDVLEMHLALRMRHLQQHV
jgi:sugar diacid utilization regulator/GAF domain-containing protein